MMNNRLNSIFKKLSSENKSSYVLEMLGFESIQSSLSEKNLIREELKKNNYGTDTITLNNNEQVAADITNDILPPIAIETIVTDKARNFISDYNTSDFTHEFKPTNITEQFKSIWINLEQRRRWLYPTFFILITSFLSFYVVDSYLDAQRSEQIVTQDFILLSDSLNTLYFTLDEIIDIATDPFFSRYGISNASADLQVVESKLIQYQNSYKKVTYDFENITNYKNIIELDSNLFKHLSLIKQLDLLLSYRILNTEILIYSDLPNTADKETINNLTTELSNISANSISNYEQLPIISQFDNHNNTLFQSIKIANELHGQYLASLRNKEIETTKSLLLSIDLNKKFVKTSYEKSLGTFRDDMDLLYDSLIPFP